MRGNSENRALRPAAVESRPLVLSCGMRFVEPADNSATPGECAKGATAWLDAHLHSGHMPMTTKHGRAMRTIITSCEGGGGASVKLTSSHFRGSESRGQGRLDRERSPAGLPQMRSVWPTVYIWQGRWRDMRRHSWSERPGGGTVEQATTVLSSELATPFRYTLTVTVRLGPGAHL